MEMGRIFQGNDERFDVAFISARVLYFFKLNFNTL